MRSSDITSIVCLASLLLAGCARDQGNLASNHGGVAVVDLERVQRELHEDGVKQTSATDLREEIKPIAKKVATERGLETVVTKDNPFVLSYGPESDITDAVIARMKGEEISSDDSEKEKETETDQKPVASQPSGKRKWFNVEPADKNSPQMTQPALNM